MTTVQIWKRPATVVDENRITHTGSRFLQSENNRKVWTRKFSDFEHMESLMAQAFPHLIVGPRGRWLEFLWGAPRRVTAKGFPRPDSCRGCWCWCFFLGATLCGRFENDIFTRHENRNLFIFSQTWDGQILRKKRKIWSMLAIWFEVSFIGTQVRENSVWYESWSWHHIYI